MAIFLTDNMRKLAHSRRQARKSCGFVSCSRIPARVVQRSIHLLLVLLVGCTVSGVTFTGCWRKILNSSALPRERTVRSVQPAYEEDYDPRAWKAAATHEMSERKYFALKVLGLDPSNATPKDARQAYRKKVRTMHPDVIGDSDGAVEAFRRIVEAYETIAKEDDEEHIVARKIQKAWDDWEKERMALRIKWRGKIKARAKVARESDGLKGAVAIATLTAAFQTAEVSELLPNLMSLP